MIRSTHGIIDSPFTKGNYINGLPNFVGQTYSLAFDAYGADRLKDYEAGTLYFRDSNFNRVGATFSRTTTATRVNRQGLIESVAANVPRIDYSDGSAKLLMEPSRTNLCDFSLLDGAGWTLQGSVTRASGISSPDGAFDAVAVNNLASSAGIFRFESVSSGTRFEDSVWLKITTAETAILQNLNPGGLPFGEFRIDLSLVPVNEWVRITRDSPYVNVITEFVGDSVNRGGHYIRLAPGSATLNNPIQLWGAQTEIGSYPTSHIPTAGSAVTRNADGVSYGSVGTKFDSSGDYTILFNIKRLATINESQFFYIRNTSFHYITLTASSTGKCEIVLYDGITAGGANTDNNSFTPDVDIKIAIKVSGSTCKIFANGVQLTLSNANVTPRNFSIYQNNRNHIKNQEVYFNTALTDSECIQLTS